MITGMLIAENSDEPAGTQQLYRSMESVAPIEHFDARASPLSTDILIDEPVPELLIDSRESDVINVMGEELRKRLPVADVTQKQDHRGPRAQHVMNRIEVFRFEMSRRFSRRHRPHLDTADQIGAQVLKMATDNSSQFSWRLLIRKSDVEIAPRQPAILRKQQPCDPAHEISHDKQNTQRQRAHDCCARAVQKVDAEIEHAR